MRWAGWWLVVSVLSLAWLLVGTDCKSRPLRETRIVSFGVTPNPALRGGSVRVVWQAEHAGAFAGVPYCTLQRAVAGEPEEPFEVVSCVGERTDVIDTELGGTFIDYQFSALRSGQEFVTEVVRLEISAVSVTVAPASVVLEPLALQDFTATVTGVADPSVTWDASCGSISGSGSTVTYTAPASVPEPATCVVTVASVVYPGASATADVTVAYGTGAVIWTRQFGTSSSDGALGVAVVGSGDIVVAGYTDGSLEGVSAGELDAFVRKYDSDGGVLWTRQFGTSSVEIATSVAVAGSGDVVVAGYTFGSLEGVSAGGFDAFVRMFDAAGDVVWTRQFGTSMSEFVTGVAFCGSGNVVVVGSTGGSLEGVSAGGFDAFVRKFDAAGNVLWTRQFGTGSDDSVTGVAVDAGGNVVVVGNTEGALEGVSAGGSDAFVRKFDAAGSVLWTRQFGTGSDDSVTGVAVDAGGDVVVAGYTFGSLEGVSAGGLDAFVRKFDAAGSVLWTRQFGTSDTDQALGVAVGSTASIVVVGQTDGSLEGVNAGVWDAFVRTYAP